MPDLMEPAPNRVKWTREQCSAIRDVGILTGRYELIEGEIISKMGQTPPHAYVIRVVMAWLVRIFGEEYIQIQLPIEVSPPDSRYNEPEPDAVALSLPITSLAERHPASDDILLLIEVADTSLRFDLSAKAGVYARAGIQEYWVVDIAGRNLIAHRQPSPNGYDEIVPHSANKAIAPSARPDASVLICDLLPPL